MFAAEPATPVRFEVEAPCADAARFAKSVTDRTPRIAPTDARDVDLVEVHIAGTEGSFRIVTPHGDASEPRTLSGATCDELVSALGLAVALAFDPDATDKPAPPPPAPKPAPVRPPVPPPVPATPAAAPSTTLAIGVQGTLAIVSRLPLGGFAFGELLSRRASVRLAFGAQHATADVATRSAGFTWGLLVPDVCPVRLKAPALELSPCLGVEIGVVEAEPHGIPDATSFTHAWIAPKPIVRARLAVAKTFAVEVQIAAAIPLARRRYTFGGVTAYEVAPVVPSLALGGWFSP
jgi:hypothetical protein